MRNGSAREEAARGAPADVWRNALARIPSTFGQLVYLASLRDPNSGRYEHHGMAQRFGEEATDEALRDCHRRAFADWLCYGLEQQKADLDLYLTSLPESKRRILETWRRLAPYRNLVPSAARDMEVRLYTADLDALLGVLMNEYGVGGPGPDA